MLIRVKNAKIKLQQQQTDQKAVHQRLLDLYLQNKYQQWKDRVPEMSRYHKDYQEIEEDRKSNQSQQAEDIKTEVERNVKEEILEEENKEELLNQKNTVELIENTQISSEKL